MNDVSAGLQQYFKQHPDTLCPWCLDEMDDSIGKDGKTDKKADKDAEQSVVLHLKRTKPHAMYPKPYFYHRDCMLEYMASASADEFSRCLSRVRVVGSGEDSSPRHISILRTVLRGNLYKP